MYEINNEFVDIPETFGMYSCTKEGVIKSNKRWIDNDGNPNGGYYINEKILKQYTNNKGYNYVDMMIHGIKKRMLVHRIVAITFLPNPKNLPMVNHKDFNPQNNNVNNLEWCSASYNINYSAAVGRYSNMTEKKYKSSRQKKYYLYKKVDQYDLNGNYIKTFESSYAAAQYLCDLGLIKNARSGSGNIIAVCKDRAKTCGGFIWKYHEEQEEEKCND